jgi:cytochrome c-type biogenesis protein CcmE
MKKTHIIAIVIIAVAIGFLMMAGKDLSTYASFADAAKTPEKVKVVGQLCKDKVVEYDPEKDASAFSFHMKDRDGKECKVRLLAAKPQEFERSEQIVLTGAMRGDEFVATEMLMKCPSKYKDEEVYIKSEKEM